MREDRDRDSIIAQPVLLGAIQMNLRRCRMTSMSCIRSTRGAGEGGRLEQIRPALLILDNAAAAG